jgi:hypothetical protein
MLNHILYNHGYNFSGTDRKSFVFLKFRCCVLAPFLCLFIIPFSCRDPLLHSSWTESPPIINGNDSDWQTVPAFKLESWSASLKLTNDAGFLYLLLTFEDAKMSRRVRIEGLTLEFAGPDNKNPLFKIRYSGPDSLSRPMESNDSFWDYLTETQKNIFRERQEALGSMITIVQNGQKMRIPAGGEQGPAAARIVGKGSAVYEFKIPLRTDKGNLYTLDTAPGKRILATIALATQRPENLTPMMAGPPGHMSDNRWTERSSAAESEIRVQIHLAVAAGQK